MVGTMKSVNISSARKAIRELLLGQKLASLATCETKQPYLTLVAFATTHDLKNIFFATKKHGKKYSDLIKNKKVSLLIDNRTNLTSDFNRGMAVTILGQAEELKTSLRNRYLKLYTKKHPNLEEFAKSSDCSLFKVEIHTYRIVSHFQQVVELHITNQA